MKKTMKKLSLIFRSNKFLMVISVLASIVLWFYVVGVYSPQTTLLFKDIPLEISIVNTVPESHNLIIVKNKPIVVSVLVEGERSSLAFLQKSDIKLKLNLNSITKAGNYDIPIEVEIPDTNLKAISITPKEVNIDFYNKSTNSVEVKVNVNGTVKEGFLADAPKAYPSSINLIGPEGKIKQIKNAFAQIDVTGADETLVKKTDFIYINDKGEPIDGEGITPEVAQITVTAPILKTKTVPLSVDIINSSGGANSKFINISISPQNIIIAGTAEIIDATNSIDIGTIDVFDVSKDGKTIELDIISPNGIKTFDVSTKAVVTLSYPEIISKSFDVKNFSFANLATGKKANPVSSSIRVTLIGIPSDINALSAENITAVVDMIEVTATGRIQFALTFQLPNEMKVGVYGKYSALINVK